jgi:hypothetical protein
MIDELLTTFRSEVAQPDRGTAERIYALATRQQRTREAVRAWPLPRPRFMLGFAAAALVLVPTAVAFGGKLIDLFDGTPAPPYVSTNFSDFNRMADLSVQQGFASKWPHADVSQAHGVIEVQTPDGPEDMWAAPNDQGGQCYFIDFADDPVGNHGAYGFGGCTTSTPDPGEQISPGEVWTYEHPNLKTVYGSVYAAAATVRLTFDDGSTASVPVVEHLYLASTARDAHAETVTAFDAAGNQIAQRALGPDAATRG